MKVWIPDDREPSGRRWLDTPDGDSDLAGFESSRTKLWGSQTALDAGAVFFPKLNGADLYVQPADIPAFRAECAMLAGHVDALTAASGFENGYVAARLHNITKAAARAADLSGGIVVW